MGPSREADVDVAFADSSWNQAVAPVTCDGGLSHRSGRREVIRDEQGAILILAMVFVLVISMSVLALLSVGGNSLLVTAQLRTQRAVSYAASGATDAAIQSVRYGYSAYTTAADCLPQSVASMSIGGVSMVVDCSGTGPVASAATRVVTFYACQQATCTASNAVLIATVAFDDYAATGALSCSAYSTTTCGTGVTITSWTVTGSNY
jgi:hypothetical protein